MAGGAGGPGRGTRSVGRGRVQTMPVTESSVTHLGVALCCRGLWRPQWKQQQVSGLASGTLCRISGEKGVCACMVHVLGLLRLDPCCFSGPSAGIQCAAGLLQWCTGCCSAPSFLYSLQTCCMWCPSLPTLLIILACMQRRQEEQELTPPTVSTRMRGGTSGSCDWGWEESPANAAAAHAAWGKMQVLVKGCGVRGR